MSNFDHINTMTAGASHAVCQLGEIKRKPDSRPYGVALSQEGYPNLSRWVDGDLADEALDEALRFLVDAVGRGSIPMLTVAGLALAEHPEQCLGAMATTDAKQQARFWSLLKMGTVLGDDQQLFRGWLDALNDAQPLPGG